MKNTNNDPRSGKVEEKRSFPWQFTFFLSSLSVGLFIFLLKLFEII